MADVSTPNKAEISRLPRWARVAFAARCARRVQPLFNHFWPDAPKKYVVAVDTAVRLAEKCASTASLTDTDAAYAAAAANAAKRTGNAANAVTDAAYAAAAATATKPTGNAANAARAAANAANFTSAGKAAIAEMRADFEFLLAAAKTEQWDDDTHIPPEFFEPIWPNGTPDGWPPSEQEGRSAPVELVIDLEVPDDVEESHVIARLHDLVGTMDQMHRGMGGGGLIVSGVKVYVDVEVRSAVPG